LVFIVVIVIQRINFKTLLKLDLSSMLNLVYLIWAFFAIFLGFAIYTDDWGFVRIFALWNILGFFIIMLSNKPLKKYFLSFSTVILLLTIVRLVIRV